MIRQGLNDDSSGCFKCVKITLLVIHILGLMGALLMIVAFFVLFHSGGSKEDLTPQQQEHLKNLSLFFVFLALFAFIYEMIAIVGIAKENKTIVITYLVLSIIGFVGNLFYSLQAGVGTLFVICLTTYYAYMIVKKDRQIV